MSDTTYRESFEEHADLLRGIGYRMLGSAADAEDLVQDTFLRLIERPPPELGSPLAPWLVRVATNLARDRLRERKRRSYPGTWLPSPVPLATDADAAGFPPEPATSPDGTPEVRYDRFESASYAFLLALEALTPKQRAVLLLRDVLDFSGRDTAEALEIGEPDVKTTLHRARKAMDRYRSSAARPTAERRAETQTVLERFAGLVARGDVAALAQLLADDVRILSDGGGVYAASRRPVIGARKVARTYVKLAEKASPEASVELRMLNGAPAIVLSDPAPLDGHAPRVVIRIELDAAGRIAEIHSVLAPDKLSAIEDARAWS